MEEYYTAQQAAEVLGLKYHTLLARSRRNPDQYPHVRVGWAILFTREGIDRHADLRDMEKTGR